MAKVLVPLADGFEELEAITVIDLLRRAGFEVITAGLNDQPVRASRLNVLIPDTSIDKVINDQFDLIFLPGGLPGADHLRDNTQVQQLIKQQHSQNKNIAAICAAPKALAAAGILNGKKITCYPGALDQTDNNGFDISTEAIEIDGNITTSRGPGTAMDLALKLIEQLGNRQLRDTVAAQMVRD
ncbi:MAG: DJ-1/PfpI family protein [Gammaproteobacteria bacterium]|nr:DJ-1/PfpI family protein [Gammaproteobacteria bacterium]